MVKSKLPEDLRNNIISNVCEMMVECFMDDPNLIQDVILFGHTPGLTNLSDKKLLEAFKGSIGLEDKMSDKEIEDQIYEPDLALYRKAQELIKGAKNG